MLEVKLELKVAGPVAKLQTPPMKACELGLALCTSNPSQYLPCLMTKRDNSLQRIHIDAAIIVCLSQDNIKCIVDQVCGCQTSLICQSSCYVSVITALVVVDNTHWRNEDVRCVGDNSDSGAEWSMGQSN
jgi:hypothetical protein